MIASEQMEDISFAVSSYEGHELEVLQLRNRNRPEFKEQRYLDWRYTCRDALFPPVIFWVRQGERQIGMAGIVFRSYLINGRVHQVGVLGDIALDKPYRGRGIACDFFHFINEYLKEHSHPLAFVLPNLVAEKALARCGWHTVDEIASFVFLLNPVDKIAARLRLRWLSRVLGLGYRFLNSIRLRSWREEGFFANFPADFDDTVSGLWRDVPKEGIIIRERSPRALHARYRLHPDSARFRIFCVSRGGSPVGIIVYSVSDDRRQCFIHELLVDNTRVIPPVMALFVDIALNEATIVSLRLTLNDAHPYAQTLKKMGFIRRDTIQALQVLEDGKAPLTGEAAWFMTAGDKDV